MIQRVVVLVVKPMCYICRKSDKAKSISGLIDKSLNFQSRDYSDIIQFWNAVFIYMDQSEVYQSLSFQINQWNIKKIIDILNYIS